VVTIWEGFKVYFRRHDFEFDYVLFSNYERQVHAHAPDPVTRQIAMLAVRDDALAGTFGLNEEVFDAAEAQQLSSLHTRNFM
jgi:hypothetical protein